MYIKIIDLPRFDLGHLSFDQPASHRWLHILTAFTLTNGHLSFDQSASHRWLHVLTISTLTSWTSVELLASLWPWLIGFACSAETGSVYDHPVYFKHGLMEELYRRWLQLTNKDFTDICLTLYVSLTSWVWPLKGLQPTFNAPHHWETIPLKN